MGSKRLTLRPANLDRLGRRIGGSKDFAHEHNTKAPEGATTGGIAGLGVGAAVGWLAGIGTLAIPGLGALIAAGPIMAALSGAAVGTAAGGLIGALIGMGMPEFEAKRYDAKVREGNILISVHTDDSRQRGQALLTVVRLWGCNCLLTCMMVLSAKRVMATVSAVLLGFCRVRNSENPV